MEFQHFVVLALVKLINGQRGKEFIIDLLRGSKSKKVRYLVRRNNLWGFYNLFGLLTRSDLIDIFEELLTHKLVEIREERAIDGFMYSFVYITSKGKERLEEYAQNFRPYLDELSTGNKRVIEFQISVLEKAKKAKVGSYSVEAVREEYPRAYRKWLEQEDKDLENEFKKGRALTELAALFQRKPGAIRSRLVRLGLMTEGNNV